jgi:hypothetical protein
MQYQSLILELHSFLALQCVDSAIRAAPLNQNVRQVINAEARRGCESLEKFWDRVKSYQAAHGVRLDGGFKDHEIVELKEKISTHRENITLLLTALGLWVSFLY